MLFITEISDSCEGTFVAKVDLLEDHIELLVGDARIAVRRLHAGVSELLLEHVDADAAAPGLIGVCLTQAVSGDTASAACQPRAPSRFTDDTLEAFARQGTLSALRVMLT